MYCCVNISLTTNALLILFISYVPVAPLDNPVKGERLFTSVRPHGHCLETQHPLDKYGDVVLPPDTRRLWGLCWPGC